MAEMQGYLTLIGNQFELKSVTDAISYFPTWTKGKNETLGNGRLFGHCEWGIETDLYISNDLTEVTNSLMNLLPCSQQSMLQVARRFNAQWNILFLIRVIDDFPSIVLSPAFSAFAAAIGAPIGFDVYLFNGE